MRAMMWYPLVSLVAPLHGLDPRVVTAIISVESGGNPDAVSRAGAIGLMQVMPREAGEVFRDRPQRQWLFDPVINIAVGCRILSADVRYYKDLDKAVMAYFAGRGNVPRDGPVTHEGALRYLALVKGAFGNLFPLSKWPNFQEEIKDEGN